MRKSRDPLGCATPVDQLTSVLAVAGRQAWPLFGRVCVLILGYNILGYSPLASLVRPTSIVFAYSHLVTPQPPINRSPNTTRLSSEHLCLVAAKEARHRPKVVCNTIHFIKSSDIVHSLILLPAVLWYFPLKHHQVSPLADASACASLEVRAQTEVRRTGVCARTLREVHVTYDISCFINDPICFVLPAQSARTRHELRCRYRRRMWLAHRPLHCVKLTPAPIRLIGDTFRTRTKIP